jgi:uncharacterized ferritin-like protein (DUF455 family)
MLRLCTRRFYLFHNRLYHHEFNPQVFCQRALQVLDTACPREKAHLTHTFHEHDFVTIPDISERIHKIMTNDSYFPKRPQKPILIDETKERIPSYKQLNVTLPVFLLHNTAHIELNAIDVAWHTILLAQYLHPNQLPVEFFRDFCKVAQDEARHFLLLCDRLEHFNTFYGAIPSHASLWQSAQNTRSNLASRICITQLVQESRALDSGDRLSKKFVSCGDLVSSRLIEQICEEEIEHVKIGVKYFTRLIESSNLSAEEMFQKMVMEFYGPIPIPLNEQARSRANLPRSWYFPISRHVIKKKSRFDS